MIARPIRSIAVVTLLFRLAFLDGPPEAGAQGAAALAGAVALAQSSADALASFAKAINAVACTIDLISDRSRAATEKQRLGTISTQLTDLELNKARFVRHVSQYLGDSSSRSWEELRAELTA